MLFLSTLLFCSFLASTKSEIFKSTFDDHENDCCQLEWIRIIETGFKRFIPSTAVLAGTSINGTKWYYIRKPNRKETGIISDAVSKLPLFYKRNGQNVVVEEDSWNDGLILANPNECVIGWWERKGETPIDETLEKKFPTVQFEHFASYWPNSDSSALGSVFEVNPYTHDFYGIQLRDRGPFYGTDYSIYILYIDCKESLMKHLSAELYDIKLDIGKLMESKDHQAVATTEVVNESDLDQDGNVDLVAEINSKVEMNHETQLRTVADTKWGVEGTLNMKFVENFLFVSASQELEIKAGYNSHTVKDNFTKYGSVRMDSSRTLYKFSQSVLMKARTKTQVVINTRPIKGSQKFTAFYRLTPSMISSSSWTNERILGSLQRVGFVHYDRIKTINETLILSYDGAIAIDSGFDTHVLISSTPLTGSPTVVKKMFPF